MNYFHRVGKMSLPEKLEFLSTPEPSCGCWLWIGNAEVNGYGTVSDYVDGKRRKLKAHRASWEVHRGKIPAGMSVLHKCDNSYCINPDHLFLGTQLENIADIVNKRRHNLGEKNGRRKLTDEQVTAIRSSPLSYSAIGKIFGISSGNVSRIKNHQNWRHLS